ncbi:hypothetical protein PSTG_19783 [Puccinia striiformis f. sp. tritici PST-78]|uniref:Uncharacterized protein n=1 Tax=Puccinia striiformis f. sp. tritici PST-78 TaxID=1165861 RepID=A0A0L0UIS3_9BASI|nr:hypothetical protein PSTG_19783 [Puccinia striiformis f. sp. tritici PST-78]
MVAALEENWVRLIGPPAPRNEPVGLESDDTNPQGTDRSKSTAGPPPLKKRKLDDTSHVEVEPTAEEAIPPKTRPPRTKRIPVIVDSTDEEDCDDEDYEEEEEQEEELEELERNLNDEEEDAEQR